jgi:hypothetical protein
VSPAGYRYAFHAETYLPLVRFKRERKPDRGHRAAGRAIAIESEGCGPLAAGASAGVVTAASLKTGLAASIVGVVSTPSGVAVVVTIAGVSLTLTLVHFVYVAFLLGLALVSFVIALYWDG